MGASLPTRSHLINYLIRKIAIGVRNRETLDSVQEVFILRGENRVMVFR
jgi:hypothetical protein